MSNIKKNSYVTLENYNDGLDYNDSLDYNDNQIETFGAFSISAAVRYPYNQSRENPNYKQKIIPGVN